MMRRGLIGAGAVALVVLLGRSLAYAAEPSPSARFLEQRAGGSALPVLALVSLTLGAAVAVAVCWLVAIAVRERALIERRNIDPFAAGRALAFAAVLSVAACGAGGLLEAFIHWRAGLGWHGLHCLVGPVHRDLLPIESGLSFVAAAILAASRYVAAWMRRTFARLAAVLPRLWFGERVRLHVHARPRPALCVGFASARAPPAPG
jgi:hypothetical protein